MKKSIRGFAGFGRDGDCTVRDDHDRPRRRATHRRAGGADLRSAAAGDPGETRELPARPGTTSIDASLDIRSETEAEYYRIRMQDVLVSSYESGGGN